MGSQDLDTFLLKVTLVSGLCCWISHLCHAGLGAAVPPLHAGTNMAQLRCANRDILDLLLCVALCMQLRPGQEECSRVMRLFRKIPERPGLPS